MINYKPSPFVYGPGRRADVVAEAMSWVGTPYHHEGAVKGSGVDCAMILVRVFADLGLIPEIDPRPYPMQWHLHRDDERYLGWIRRYARPVTEPQPGDIALYRFGRCISHSSILVTDGLMVHAHLRDGAVVLSERRSIDAERLVGHWSVFP